MLKFSHSRIFNFRKKFAFKIPYILVVLIFENTFKLYLHEFYIYRFSVFQTCWCPNRSQSYTVCWHFLLNQWFTCDFLFTSWIGSKQRQIQRRLLLFASISETDDRLRFYPRFHRNSNCLPRHWSLLVHCAWLFKLLSQSLVETISIQ